MTTAEAAAALGVSRRRVLALIEADRLIAERHGRDWWIEPAALEAVRVRRPGWRKGRPRAKQANN